MPTYTYGCDSCGSQRDVLVDYEAAQNLELICLQCGGTQKLMPVLVVNFLLTRASQADPASSSREARGQAQRQLKACGHARHCRCAVTLTKPNPFRKEIRKAAGIVDED